MVILCSLSLSLSLSPSLFVIHTDFFHSVCLSQTHCVKLVKLTPLICCSVESFFTQKDLLSGFLLVSLLTVFRFPPSVPQSLSVTFSPSLSLWASGAGVCIPKHTYRPSSSHALTPPFKHWFLDQCQPECSWVSPLAYTSPPGKQSCLSLHSDITPQT